MFTFMAFYQMSCLLLQRGTMTLKDPHAPLLNLAILILSFQMAAGHYDINVSPDKREFFIRDEANLLERLANHLQEFFEDI